jgi:CHASE2 domain-containing sensor protein
MRTFLETLRHVLQPERKLRAIVTKMFLGTPARYGLTGAALVATLGWLLFRSPMGTPLAMASYDLSTCLNESMGGNSQPTNAAIVYVDSPSLTQLGRGDPPERAVYADLLVSLKAHGAKLVVFDVAFEGAKPGDDKLTEAFRTNGPVLIVAAYEAGISRGSGASNTHSAGKLIKPEATFTNVVAGVGYASIDSSSPPSSPRRRLLEHNPYHSPLDDGIVDPDGRTLGPLAAWLAAKVSPVSGSKWLRYYGPPYASVRNMTLDASIKVPGNAFRDRVVFVGSHPNWQARDAWSTPFLRFTQEEEGKIPGERWGELMPGVEIHATTFCNLVNGDWLVRPPDLIESALVGLVVPVVSLGLILVRKFTAIILTLLVAFGILTASEYFFHRSPGGIWWAWAIPVFVQLPAALIWRTSSSHRPLSIRQTGLFLRGQHVAFISYRRSPDRGEAEWLVTRLEERGWLVYWDQENLIAGQFPEQLRKNIARSAYFILIVTPQTFKPTTGFPSQLTHPDEDWIRNELTHAEKKLTREKIIPIWRGDKPTRAFLGDLDYIRDCHGIEWTKIHDNEALDQLERLLFEASTIPQNAP